MGSRTYCLAWFLHVSIRLTCHKWVFWPCIAPNQIITPIMMNFPSGDVSLSSEQGLHGYISLHHPHHSDANDWFAQVHTEAIGHNIGNIGKSIHNFHQLKFIQKGPFNMVVHFLVIRLIWSYISVYVFVNPSPFPLHTYISKIVFLISYYRA